MRLRYAPVLAVALLLASATAALASTGFVANLDGLQEVPPVATPASGTGYCVLNNSQTMLSYSVTYSGLIGTRSAAHFHGPALPGVNAGVVFGIAGAGPSSDTIIGVWPIDATNVTRLMSGLLYLNVHSTFRPGGEIRGQLGPDATPALRGSWGKIKSLYR